MTKTFAVAGGAAMLLIFGTMAQGQNAVVLQAPGAASAGTDDRVGP